MEEKNRVLLDRLFKSEKQLNELKETVEALSSKAESQKDKKIVELVKKNKALNLQCDGLKVKAAKAAEFALELKKENDAKMTSAPPLKAMDEPLSPTINGLSGSEAEKRVKDAEKKMVRLRNENQE